MLKLNQVLEMFINEIITDHMVSYKLKMYYMNHLAHI